MPSGVYLCFATKFRDTLSLLRSAIHGDRDCQANLDYARRERVSRGLIRLAAKNAMLHFTFAIITERRCNFYGANRLQSHVNRRRRARKVHATCDARYKKPAVFPIASNSKINQSADHPFQSHALACFSFKSQLAPIEAPDSSRIEIPTLFPNFRISDAPRRGEAGSGAIIVAEIYRRG